jgi:ATP-binding cassette subfamily C protein LapB
MDDKVGKGGSALSGGQKAMVWFLRAVMQKSSLIISDEPGASLDPQSKKQVTQMLDIIAKDRAIILITHDMDMLVNFDRVITFEKGKFISDINQNNKKSNNNKNGWN